MASLDHRTVFAIALTCACSSPDFSASDAAAGAGAMTGGGAGAASRHSSGGTAGSSAAGASSSSGGRSSATGGASARGGSTSGSGDTSGGGEADTGGSASTGGSPSPGGTSGSGGSGRGGSGGSSQGGSDAGGAGGTGGTGGTGQGGSGGDTSPAGMGGGSMAGGAGLGMAGGGASGLGGGGGAGGTGGSAGTGGTIPIAGAPNAGSGGVVGGCDNQLLANAEFEAGPTPSWGEESTWPGIEIIVATGNSALQAEGVTPYAGNYLAWLGGIPDNEWDHHMVILTQDVTLPADAATLTLSGRRYVKSIDDPSELFDVAYLEFDDEDGDVVWQAQAWSNQTTTNGWVAFESSTSVATALRGRKLTFVAYSRTDPEGKTSFFLDNLRLEASCGR